MIRKIDLSGVWQFCLDPENSGETDGYFRSFLPKRINIPGTVSAQRLSPPSIPTNYGYADPLEYVGGAWYQRDFQLPREFNKNDYTVFLTLERTRPSKVWINAELAGSREYVALPHVYNITDFVVVGENHLTILIDNTEIAGKYGNLTAPDGQTNWNGICGKVTVTIHNRVYLDDINLEASDGDVHVTGKLCGGEREEYTAYVISSDNDTYHKQSGFITDGKLDFTYSLGKNFRYFDEFSKHYYTLRITIGGENADVYETNFGFTDFAERKGMLFSNNREIYIRGIRAKNCMPDHGAPPCETVFWIKTFKTGERFAGINTWVFVDTVPPEEVFEAADSLGIYVALDLSTSVFSDEFITGVMRYFGAHPSLIKLPKNVERLNDYPFFPDFDELLKSQVMYDYRLADEYDRVNAAGLMELSDRYFSASALYAKESFKLDIDKTALNMNLCGYLLPIAKWAKYEKAGGTLGYGNCSLVSNIEKFSYTAGQKFSLSLMCCNFTGTEILFSEVGIRIFDGADLLFENTVKRERPVAHGRKSLGSFDVIIPECQKPNMLRLEIFADDKTRHWDIFVFPQADREPADDIIVTDDIFKITNSSEKNRKFLFFPDTISPDYLMPESVGKELPVGTLGLLIENRHPIFSGFPCRSYLTARWRELVVNTVSILLDNLSVTPIIRVIDNAIRNNRLGVLFEVKCEDKNIVVCTINIPKNRTPSALALYNSIIKYMNSEAFAPKETVTMNELRIMFTK
jgi:hypothetical protein